MLNIKHYTLFLILLISFAKINAQGINNLWLMGYASGAGNGFGGTTIDFFSGTADTSYQFRTMNFLETNASISDRFGNLLFYTNGVYIANANNDTMVNGDNLSPSTYTTSFANDGLAISQGVLIIPFPDDTTKYYLFHETVYNLPSIGNYYKPLELYYSIVDMNLNGGLGQVIQKNNVVINDTLNVGAVTACKHANGRDWWVICHRVAGNGYYTLLVTPYGIRGPYLQYAGSYFTYDDLIWQSCFSPDGNKFASFTLKDTLDIFKFDRCTGILSDGVSININDSCIARGLSFSKNSKLLYASSTNYLYQFNTDDTNIVSSKIKIGTYDGFIDSVPPFYTFFYLAQLANDGKIYINTPNGTHYLHVINYPDSVGLACDFQQHEFVLPTYNSESIPNFPNYFLQADTSNTICDSLTYVASNNYSDHIIAIYPNPCVDHTSVYLLLNLKDKIWLSVYDKQGRELYSEQIKKSKTELKMNYSPGVYFFQIRSAEKIYVARVIKLD